MKTFLQCLVVVFVVFSLVKCSTEPEPEPPKEIVVSGNINVSPTSIKAGETVTISWSEMINVKTLIINDTPISISDGSKSYTLTSTTTFVVKFIGPNNEFDQKSFTVNVTVDPDKARTDSLCLNKYWKLISTKALLSNGTWGSDPLSEEELSLKRFYYSNGTMEIFRPSDGKLIGNSKWAWLGKNSIIWNNNQISTYKMYDNYYESYSSDGKTVSLYKYYPL